MKVITSFSLDVVAGLEGAQKLKQGTAFFVGPHLVATALHVVWDDLRKAWYHEFPEHDDVKYVLTSSDLDLRLYAKAMVADPVADLALLFCAETTEDIVVAKLVSSSSGINRTWSAAGYMDTFRGHLKVIRGTVDRIGKVSLRNALDLGLTTSVTLPPYGFSGSAVQVADGDDDAVIGVLTLENTGLGLDKLDAASSDALHALRVFADELRHASTALGALTFTEQECRDLLVAAIPQIDELREMPCELIQDVLLRVTSHGREALTRFCARIKELRPQLIEAAIFESLDHNISALDPLGPLQLDEQPSGIYVNRVRLNGSIDELAEAWGDPRIPGSVKPIDIALRLRWFGGPSPLQAAIIRLAVHGGVRMLYVPEAAIWHRAILDAGPGCLGISSEGWHPVLLPAGQKPQAHDGRWYIATLIAANIDNSPSLLLPDSATNDLEHTLDRWTLLALDARMRELIDGHIQPKWFEWRIANDLRKAIGPVWLQWHNDLLAPSAFELRERFFRTMLVVRTGQSGPSESALAGRIRIGPRIVKECLVYGLVFALIIETAGRKGTSPISSDRYNLLHDNKKTHLVALQNVGQQQISERLAGSDRDVDLMLSPGYAFLPHCHRNFSIVNSRFSRSDEIDVGFKEPDESEVALICRDDGFRAAMTAGLSEVSKYLATKIYAPQRWYFAKLMRALRQNPTQASR